jgi:hypothetical protein
MVYAFPFLSKKLDALAAGILNCAVVQNSRKWKAHKQAINAGSLQMALFSLSSIIVAEEHNANIKPSENA